MMILNLKDQQLWKYLKKNVERHLFKYLKFWSSVPYLGGGQAGHGLGPALSIQMLRPRTSNQKKMYVSTDCVLLCTIF